MQFRAALMNIWIVPDTNAPDNPRLNSSFAEHRGLNAAVWQNGNEF